MIRIGSQVTWTWASGTGRGKVIERFERRVSRTLQGSKITRNASPDCPAYLIEQDDGAQVLKLASEVAHA